MPRRGNPVARQIPFSVVSPIRNPVKLPGPRQRARPSRLCHLSSHSCMIVSISASKRFEWVTLEIRVCSSMHPLFETMATLPYMVEVSMQRRRGASRSGCLGGRAISLFNCNCKQQRSGVIQYWGYWKLRSLWGESLRLTNKIIVKGKDHESTDHGKTGNHKFFLDFHRHGFASDCL